MLIAPTRSIVHCHALDPRRHVSILATFAFVSPRLAAVAIVSRSRSRCSGSEIMLNGLIYNVCFCCREQRGKERGCSQSNCNAIVPYNPKGFRNMSFGMGVCMSLEGCMYVCVDGIQ